MCSEAPQVKRNSCQCSVPIIRRSVPPPLWMCTRSTDVLLISLVLPLLLGAPLTQPLGKSASRTRF